MQVTESQPEEGLRVEASRVSPPPRTSGLRPPVVRVVKWLGGAVVLALAGWSAVAFAQWTVDGLREPPPTMDVQLARLYQETAKEGFRVVQNRPVDLKGTDEPSRVLVLRPRRSGTLGLLDQEKSDELRIYDVEDDVLRLKRRFRPRVDGAKLVNQAIQNMRFFDYFNEHWSSTTFQIQIRQVDDLNHDAREEIIGALQASTGSADDEAAFHPHPISITWNPLGDKYSITPIMRGSHPRLRKLKLQSKYRSLHLQRLGLYETPIPVVDDATKERFNTQVVDDFVVINDNGGVMLVAAYTIWQTDTETPRSLYVEIKPWRFYLDDASPPLGECLNTSAVHEVKPHFSPSRVLLAHVRSMETGSVACETFD